MRDPGQSALLTDLYQLTMLQGYRDRRMEGVAAFEFFVRRLPETRSYLVAAGLDQVLQFLEGFHFDQEDILYLRSTGLFSDAFLGDLGTLRFEGDVYAMPEGTVFFADEPILRIVAPLPQAQIVETRIINLLQFQTLIASKAARVVSQAPRRQLVDFGLRRAHGAEAGLLAARASYLVGFTGTSAVLAGRAFGIPIFGTMAHSFVQAFDDEAEAFAAFARSQPENVVLLIDTYDTLAGARKVLEIAPSLHEEGITIKAVRLDSGDLAALAAAVRGILDEGGLTSTGIFASGGLDEHSVGDLVAAGAPIDGFGVGTSMNVSADAPYLNCAYKLVEYEGKARHKTSSRKATLPGRKQVHRRYEAGVLAGDTIGLEGEAVAGTPLLMKVMSGGARVGEPEPMNDMRERTHAAIAELPDYLRSLAPPQQAYPVGLSAGLKELARSLSPSPHNSRE